MAARKKVAASKTTPARRNAAPKKAVARKESNLPVKARRQARGMEDVTTEDLAIPRIKLLQDMSAEVKKRDANYVEGAEVGMMLNSVTKELYGEVMTIVPVKYYRKWLVWSSSDSDAQLMGVFDVELEAKQTEAKDEAYVSMFTPTYIVLVITDDEITEASLPMPSTKIKVARNFNSAMKLAQADSFGRAYTLESVEASNAKGEFFNYSINPDMESFDYVDGFFAEDDPIYLQAEALYESLSSGQREIASQSFSERDLDAEAPSSDDAGDEEDDIPF